jgi:DNA-binding NtrC family response regulator
MVNDIEKQYLQRLLQTTSGDIAAACTLAHLSRSRLYDLLKFHSLTGPLDSRPE